MKNLWQSILLFTCLLLTSCSTYLYEEDPNQLPCERDQVGTVCFQNETRKLIKMEIGRSNVEIAAYTTLCVDVYQGEQEFKGKQGTKRWKGWVDVYPCEQYFVELFR